MARKYDSSPFDGAITAGALFLIGGAVVRTVILGSPIADIDFKTAIQAETFSSEHIAALATASAFVGIWMMAMGLVARLARS